MLLLSAQNFVHMICDSLSLRLSPPSEKKKQATNPDLTDVVLFKLLEQYLERLKGPLALQVWERFLQLAKEIAGSTRDFKPQTFPTLRKDIVVKLLDSCVGYVGQTYGSGSWIRHAKVDEKLNTSSVTLVSDTLKPGATNKVVMQINEFIATVALPDVRWILTDNDKVSSACANIVYYITGPSLKGKSKPMEVEAIIVTMVYEMSRMPSAFKTWRFPVTELLNDNRLFNGASDAAEVWKPIIKTIFDTDKTAIPELLNKISTTPSANIFTNREYKMLLHSLNLRRLSFVLLTGDKNHYLTILPSIREKLVNVLCNVTAPIVQSEVYLCIRVLLCRPSPRNLTSFWPVLLTELASPSRALLCSSLIFFVLQYHIFEQIMLNLPSDGSEDLPLVLAACKCLDPLIAIQTKGFRNHYAYIDCIQIL
ncbi:hypothetical protein BT96DRAFT_1088416 [Gymnopus androsaceus JB14]|uniref:DOP1-like C-terminal domain-containing protein n=1 Tax=Gymnopus androsaceus JB14 TaxID=1447944 RepID=A0A6A4HWI0_9AGAR|nr:hypothetical protein BT96DRAFT_1088416 [Gymnopus androsaceus JB14]